jgi:hypothetical protein
VFVGLLIGEMGLFFELSPRDFYSVAAKVIKIMQISEG